MHDAAVSALVLEMDEPGLAGGVSTHAPWCGPLIGVLPWASTIFRS